MKKYLLIICLLLGSLTVQAKEVFNGQCGDNAFWVLEDSVLTVSGTGPMKDYFESEVRPWNAICSNVKKVIISGGITYIGDTSFSNFKNLEEVEIAGSVETIGTWVFVACYKLRKVVLSEGIKNFNRYSFYDLTLLPSIILPSTTEFIGEFLFQYCGLKEIICLAHDVPKALLTLYHMSDDITIYVPEESIDAYKADVLWGQFERILGLNSVKWLVFDTLRHETFVRVDVSDTIHHQVNVYDTVHSQVLCYDRMDSESYDYTVVFDTVYSTYKVWVNDYDTITVYATDTIYTDIFYSSKYVHENIFVYDTVTGYIFDESVYLEEMNPAGIHNVIQKDETVEIFSIDGHSAGYHRMDNMPGLGPGIYILRSLRTDNRLKIRVK